MHLNQFPFKMLEILTQTVGHYHLLLALAVHSKNSQCSSHIVASAIIFFMCTTSGHFQ